MTNPTPRPALRKADDAGIHPAAPKPARSPRTRTAAPASPAADASAPARAAKAPAKAPAKTASKEPVPAPVEAAAAPAANPRSKHRGAGPAKPTDRPKGTRAFQGTTSDHLRRTDAPATPHDELHGDKPAKAKKKADDLMSGGTGTLKVTVPKKLRKAAEKEAKRRGLDVDAVVADLLHAWLTARR
jgi:hypothetical protein